MSDEYQYKTTEAGKVLDAVAEYRAAKVARNAAWRAYQEACEVVQKREGEWQEALRVEGEAERRLLKLSAGEGD